MRAAVDLVGSYKYGAPQSQALAKYWNSPPMLVARCVTPTIKVIGATRAPGGNEISGVPGMHCPCAAAELFCLCPVGWIVEAW